jgi:hypothetical protein
MSSSLASGALLAGIEAFKAQLQALPGDVSSEESRLDALELAIKQFYR